MNLGTCSGFEGRIEKGTIILVERTIVYDIIEQMLDFDESISQPRPPTLPAHTALSYTPRHLAEPFATRGVIELQIPTTVQGVLASRIDRLPTEEKMLLQTLALIGKEFPWSLLKQVVDQPDERLHSLLAHPQTMEFLYEQPAFPEPEYSFKHALTQEMAYTSLLTERRQELHEQTAQAIETLFHHQIEDHYNQLAHHCSRSRNITKAVDYLQRAGQQAVQRSAHADAINHVTTALELLKALPETRERSQQELDCQTTLASALGATEGWSASEVERVYTRALELCRQVGDTSRQICIGSRESYY
ncbi:MAG: hypothetical protein HY731_00795 [Candidatus Tectomicrobia bacterium]|nr:hypothetical protein [Candidatus Tectomicrobia bacterium]